MITNISANTQTRANMPNFKGATIYEPIRKLAVLGNTPVPELTPRDATNKEVKTALECIMALLEKSFEFVTKLLDSEGASRVTVGVKDGSIDLIQKQGKNFLERSVYDAQDTRVETLKIDDADGELSVNNTNLLQEVSKKLMEKVVDVPIFHFEGRI